MSAGVHNFDITKGSTLSKTFTWKDSAGSVIDITGFTARMQVRPTQESATKILDLTTENGGITLGGAAGTIVLAATAVATAAITQERGVYDLELVSGGGVVTPLLKGIINFIPEVTR